MARPGWRRGIVGTGVSATVLSLAAVLLTARTSAAPSAAAAWESKTAGLLVKSVSSLRVTARGPEIWYASVAGTKAARMGFCETRDKGKEWKSLLQGIDEPVTPLDAFEITIDPKDDKILYVVTRGKIFRSTNAGQGFEDVSAGTTTYSKDRSQSKSSIAGVAVDPSNSKRLLAGTITSRYYGGLFESRDGAKSWTQIAGTGDRKELIDSHLSHDAWPISLDKSDKYALVGGMWNSAWLSEDRGVVFKPVQPGGPAGVHRAFALTPMMSGEVLLAESRGLWRSRDRGSSWGKEAVLPGACLAVDVDPGNRRLIYAIIRGQGLYRTENLPKWDGPKHFELDPHDVIVHPHTKNTVFLTSKTTGLWISTDRGDTFQSLAERIPSAIPGITHAAAHPADPRQMLAVTDTGWVFVSQDAGTTWAHPGGNGSPGWNIGSPVTRLFGDPSAPGTWLAAGYGVFVTTDLGAKWQQTFVSRDPEDRVVDLVRRADGAWLALWERDGRISVSHDGGKTWDASPLARPTNSKSAWGAGLSIDPRDPKHMLVAMKTSSEEWNKDDKDGGPYETKDGGATWTFLDAGFRSDKGAWREGWNRGAAAAIDPSGAMLYAVDGIGVFRMEPPGADGKPTAWAEVAMSGAPSQPEVTVFVAAPTAAGGVEYIAQLEGLTTRALVRSVDGGKTWAPWTPDPGVRIESLTADTAAPGRYIAGDPTGEKGVLIYQPPGGTPPPPVPPVVPPAPPPVAPVVVKERPVKGLVAYTGGADKALRVFDLHDGKATPFVGAHDGPVLAVAMTADEKTLFTGGADRLVRLWKGEDGSTLGRLEGHTGAVTALCVSADGNTLFAGDADARILVWDLKEKKIAGKLEGHTAAITALALSADGTRLVSASHDKSVKVWDVATRREAKAIPGAHPADALTLALSPDGKRLYVGGADSSIRVFDLSAPAAPPAPAGPPAPPAAPAPAPGPAPSPAPAAPAGPTTWSTKQKNVTVVALSPDGALLYVGGDQPLVEALSTADGAAKTAYALGAAGTDAGTASLAVSSDGRWVVAGGSDGLVRLWRDGQPEAMWTSGKDHTGAIYSILLSPDKGEPEKCAPGGEPAMSESPPSPPAMGEAPPAPAMAEPPSMAETPPAMGDGGGAMSEPPAMSDAPAMSEPPPAMSDAGPAMGK